MSDEQYDFICGTIKNNFEFYFQKYDFDGYSPNF